MSIISILEEFNNMFPNISIVIPVYRSELTLPILHRRLLSALKKIKTSYEIIYIDDGSSDNSWKVLCDLYTREKNIRIIQLTQNFGQHNALMCGLSFSKGKYVVTLDDDLQNPPEEIIKLVSKIKESFDVVYGKYSTKKHSLFRNIGSFFVQIAYRNIFKVKNNLTSFRIIKSEIVKEILKYSRNYTFIDGLIAWQTNKIGYVEVIHNERKRGKSNYNIFKLIILTLNMITNFSIFPLQLASIGGFIFSFMGLILAGFYFLKKIFFGIPVTGFTSIMLAILIFSGVQLITIGLIGEYIGRIHLNINQKPQYTIRMMLNRKNV